jgi:hypothetical protein
MLPFWGPLRLRFLSVTVVVCLLSLSWLQASTEDQAVAVSHGDQIHGLPNRQFWTQPRPPEDEPIPESRFTRSLTGMGGRRGLRARHGINRLRKVASMGKQWMQLHRYNTFLHNLSSFCSTGGMPLPFVPAPVHQQKPVVGDWD